MRVRQTIEFAADTRAEHTANKARLDEQTAKAIAQHDSFDRDDDDTAMTTTVVLESTMEVQ